MKRARARADLARVIASHLPDLEARLRARAVERVAGHAMAELGDGPPAAATLLATLLRIADHAVGELARLQAEAEALVVAYQSARTARDRQEMLLAYLRSHAADALSAARDTVAVKKRWLDLSAVQERISVQKSDRIDDVEVAYRAARSIAEESPPEEVARVLEDPARLATLIDHAAPDQRDPVRTSALRAAAALLGAVGKGDAIARLGAPGARKVARWARGDDASRWVQVAAFELAAVTFGSEVLPLARERLLDRSSADGMVIRRNVLRIVAAASHGDEGLRTLLLAKDDPSEHVRQGLAAALAQIAGAGATTALREMCLVDPSPRVRGFALRELARRAIKDERARPIAADVVKAALAQPDAVVTRVAFEAIRLLSCGPIVAVSPAAVVAPLVALAHRADVRPELAEEASAVLRLLEVESTPALSDLRSRVLRLTSTLLEGESAILAVPPTASERDLERALLVAARGDMTVSLRRLGALRYRLTRGEPRRLSAWRLVHELRTPMPDKRKGWDHTHGRAWSGEIVVPPVGMAEVTPTRVPGERQLSAKLGTWGPFLPRVDDLLAAASWRGRSLRLVTSMGVVVVEGPARLADRLRAWSELTRRYEPWVEARERSLSSDEPSEQQSYGAKAKALGFSIRIGEADGSVLGVPFAIGSLLPARFYGTTLPVLPGAFEIPLAYFLSPTGNSPTHLAIVAWVIFSFLVVRAALVMRGIEKARQAIPLRIGGWGTRGKSGSERLKAALFHALRYDVVVKTTGCEAMFIHAMRDLPAQEIFLHRPYDKATIWEQRNVLTFAARLRAQVFLWECMALQPRFVDTLVGEWMKERITTITNAYPDHEDIQGPTGEDVARVIGRFAAPGGITFSTEDQMLPLLKDAARRRSSDLRVVAPLEAELLPADLVARMPYQEHPRNIAMVLALAEHLGVDRELALVEIADHVVLDLGVLKTYPTVEYLGRRLTFSNGMSANERAGFLSCWFRLEFDEVDIDHDPRTATVLVVNNRADRVARSRVFAQILACDVAVDHVVMIGTNLGGLYQFTLEALDGRLAQMKITGEGGTERALARFDEAMRRLKVIRLDETDLVALLGSGAAAPESSPDERDLAAHVARILGRKQAAADARAEIEAHLSAGRGAEADAAFRRVYRQLFVDRLAVLSSSASTGDQVVDFIARQIAPGRHARVMGCQNIKGTGLDFVYRWLSIDKVRTSLQRAASVPNARGEVLEFLSSYSDFGLIDCREALRFLGGIKDAPDWAPHRNMVTGVIERLSLLEAEKAKKLGAVAKAGRAQMVWKNVEQLVDHLDSVRSRRNATQIMEDLFAGRVGHDRAALLFRDLTARQKGGWLAKDLAALLERRGARVKEGG
jgi:poly-gamma-glutamate synthase PgsB/CapB